MRKSLWVIVVALSFGSGAFAEETLLDITAGTNVRGKPDFKGKDGEWVGRAMDKNLFENLTFFNIKKRSGPKNVNVEYRCKFYYYGETEWKREGEDCVTSKGRALLVGFALRLTGEGAKNYTLTYQCRLFNADVIFSRLSPQYCAGRDDTELGALLVKLVPTKAYEDQAYEDAVISVNPYRLKLADPPKVAFVARVFGGLSKFYIAYQPKDGTIPLKKTSDVTVGPNDGRRYASAQDKFGYYGDYLGRKDELVSDDLVPNTEYVYWLMGNYKDDPNEEYKSPQLGFKTTALPGLKMGLLTDQASQYGVSSINFAGVIGKAKEDGVAYIEYGTNPSKLDQKTKEKSFSKGEDVWYAAIAQLMQPGETYFYRLAADYSDGDTAKGNTLNIKLKELTVNTENPCFDPTGPLPSGMTFRLSDDLAVVCKAYRVGPSVGPGLTKGGAVDDQLVCPEQFPRNLNTKPFDFKIPKTDIGLSWEQAGPGFWRSSVDVRFNDWMIWAKKGYEGQQQPVRQGTQNYSAINWNPKEQTLIVWIYCSKNWSSPNTFK